MEKQYNYWRDKKVLITGHEGFLGSHLTRTLLSYGAKIVGVDKVKERRISVLNGLRNKMACIQGNISNLKLMKKIIDSYRMQVIFHLAAEAIVGTANKRPVQTFKSNIEGTWNILEASRGKEFIKGVVMASSDKAYGSHKVLPYKEDAILKGDHPYDVSKSCGDLLASSYFHTFRIPVAITRCGNVYGPGDFNFSRVIPDAVRCALLDKTLLIRSDGKFIRDYVYVDDVINGYILLAEKLQRFNMGGEAFNFSNENPTAVIDLVDKVYEIAGKKPDYKILNQTRYEIRRQFLDSSKAKRILGWRPRFDLDRGLQETIRWYRDLLKGHK